MKSQFKTGVLIAILASLLGGAINYLMEGDPARALFVVLIGFALALIIMALFAFSGKQKR